MKKSGLIIVQKKEPILTGLAIRFLMILLLVSIISSTGCKKSEEDPPPPTTVLPFSDDFNGTTLNSDWKWANEPNNWDLGTSRQGWLNFTGNLNANIFCDDNTTRLYQQITTDQDFEIATKLYCEWGNNPSDVAGIIIKSAISGEWVLLKLWMHGNGSGRLEFQTDCNDLISPVPGSESWDGNTEVSLMLHKSGSDYSAYFMNEEDENWILIGSTQFLDTQPVQFGIFGGVDSGDGNLLIQFDYFRYTGE